MLAGEFMDKIVFLIIYVSFLVGILILVYRTRAIILGILFIVVLLTGPAFYLFQYGALSSFTLKAFFTEASFVKEKAKEVKQDAETIDNIKKSVKKQANDIKQSEQDITDVRDNVFGIESDLVKVKRGIVEIQKHFSKSVSR